VKILTPQRGEKVRLVEMARQNAVDELRRLTSGEAARAALLSTLQQRLHMDRLPERIECFDNSNMLGTSPVSGMVVFRNGAPSRKDYRKYILKTIEKPDDYAAMAEVLKRRYGKGVASAPLPDLLMVDGGKGQLNIAAAVMRELGIDGAFHLIGIAKKDEAAGETRDKIYLPGRANPVNLERDEAVYHLLQQIRDEAHRFAISFHRRRRGKQALSSALDGVPGVGPARRRALLRHFGSIKKIRAATLEELRAVPGISQAVAEALIAALRQ
jgi:excinuclease ABC subunit C